MTATVATPAAITLPAAVLATDPGREATARGPAWVDALTTDYRHCVLRDGLPEGDYVEGLSAWGFDGTLDTYLAESGLAPAATAPAPSPDASATLLALLQSVPADTLAAVVAQLQGTPVAPAVKAAAVAAPAGTVTVSVDAMTPTQLREAITRRMGFTPTTGWNVEQLRSCYLGRPGAHPRLKSDCQLAAVKLRGYEAPKSWSAGDIWEYAQGRKEQRGAAFKAAAVAKYAKAFDAVPPKSWTAARIATAVVTGVAGKPGVSRPGTGGFGAKRADGLTADACKKLITAALASGKVTAEQAKGRSSWKADQLRAFVTTHNLTVAA